MRVYRIVLCFKATNAAGGGFVRGEKEKRRFRGLADGRTLAAHGDKSILTFSQCRYLLN